MAFSVERLRDSLRDDLAARAADWRIQRDPLWTCVSADSRRHLVRLIDWLARERPDVYTLFGDEDGLFVALADAAEHLNAARWTLDDLLGQVRKTCSGRWVISVPLVGAVPPRAVRSLDEDLVLTPANRWRKNGESGSAFRREVARLTGAPAEIGSRYVHDIDRELIDTRRTATLVAVLHGTLGVCRRIAFEQCRFLLAGWTLFAPPADEFHTPMWPQISEWKPQAQMHRQDAAYRVERDGSAVKRAGMNVLHPPNEASFWAWPDDAILLLVLRGVRAAGTSRAATALLTVAWDLYLAARNPSDAPWIERLVHVMHAREALCEDPSGDRDALESRFRTVCRRLAIVEAIRPRGWGAHDIQLVGGELRRLRNLATHSSDVSRLRLGYTPTRQRGKLESSRVAEIYVREGTSPAFHVMRELCMEMWVRNDAHGYDDEHFEAFFR